MDKPEWFLKLYWNFGFIVTPPSWKHYPVSLYLSRYIIMLRMRPDMKHGHVVMFNNQSVGMQV